MIVNDLFESSYAGNTERAIARNLDGIDQSQLDEFAPNAGGNGGNYLKALASAWYNGTFNTGDLHKGIKSQEDVERILERGIHCGDGKVRKYSIGYNADFNGVEIQSEDHYEYSDYDDAGNDIDSRTGKPWGPYDVVEFSDDELDESVEQDVAEGFSAMLANATSRADLKQIRNFVTENVRNKDAQRQIMEQATQIVAVQRRKYTAHAVK